MNLQFTLRDILWLTIVVALAAGWRIERASLQARNDELESRVEQLSGFIRPFSDAPTGPIAVLLALIGLCVIAIVIISLLTGLRHRRKDS